jgi:hypothetical protein
MKAKALSAVILIVSLTFVFLVAASAQEMRAKNEHSTTLEIMSDDRSVNNPAQAFQDPPNLYYTMQITFTSASTIYLPVIIKSYHIFDFEGDCEGWGKQPLNQPPQPCQGVTPSTEVAFSGKYSLRFDDLGPYSLTTTQDVGVNYDAYNQKVTARVYLPKGAPSIPAVIHVQDATFVWHQSLFVNLSPGKWNQISFNLCGQPWPHPYKSAGLHFTPGNYTGPVHVDYVVFEKC